MTIEIISLAICGIIFIAALVAYGLSRVSG